MSRELTEPVLGDVDLYAGFRRSATPQQLALYERLIWEVRPQVVIAAGTSASGRLLWLRDRLFDFQRYRIGPAPLVLAIDADLATVRADLAGLPPEGRAGIDLLSADPAGADRIVASIPRDAEVLVILTNPTLVRDLRVLGPLIRSNGVLILDADTNTDTDTNTNTNTELDQWLATDPLGGRFRRERDDAGCVVLRREVDL